MSSSLLFMHADWLGTGRAWTNLSGTVVQDCQSFPFGDSLYCQGSANGTDDNFAGMTYDPEDAMYHASFREYSPVQGRWIRPDPAGLAAVDPTNPQTWNRYTYVANDPMSLTDPLGLYKCDPDYGDCGQPPCYMCGGPGGGCNDYNGSLGSGGPSGPTPPFGVGGSGGGGFGAGCGSDFLPCGPPISAGPGLPCDLGACNSIGDDLVSGIIGLGTPDSPFSIDVLVLASMLNVLGNSLSVAIYCNPARGWLPTSHCGVVTKNGDGTYTACDGGASGNWLWSTLTVGCNTQTRGPSGPPTSVVPASPNQVHCVQTMARAINNARPTYNFFWSNSNSAAFAMTAGCGLGVQFPSDAWGAW